MRMGARAALAGLCFAAGVLAAWLLHGTVRDSGSSLVLRPGSPRVRPDIPVSPGVLWVLAIGVSAYVDPNLQLRFADHDAETIAAALQRQRGTLYYDVRARVLTNAQVTRESVLDGIEHFLGGARLDDVVVIMLAGHGVQDNATGSYYFLPAAASGDSARTIGVRMSDLDEMLQVVRSNVRAVVVLLDTCHAGSLRLAHDPLMGSDLVAHMPAGEGFFLLGASRPGEESSEREDLQHGAFTYALLEALEGAADADADGLLSVSDLFAYVSKRVPALTGGVQHPYQKVEGSDLLLAAVPSEPQPTAAVNPAGPLRSHVVSNTIGVIEFHNLRGTVEHDWIGKAIRVAFNTELSKVRSLRVYVPQVIDESSGGRREDYLAAAHQLGIRRLITGSYQVVGSNVRIDAEIVDTAAGVQEASDSVEGSLDDFFALQKQLVLSMLRRLSVQPSAEEEGRIRKDGSTDVNAYRLLLETEGVMQEPTVPSPTVAPPARTPTEHSRLGEPRNWLAQWLLPRAQAAEPAAAAAAAIRGVLEEFRGALEAKDMDRLAKLYVSFSAQHRAVLGTYLGNADDLRVELSDVTYEVRDAGVLVAYTRVDRFIDHGSGRPVRLEARLARLFVREGDTWKLGDAQ